MKKILLSIFVLCSYDNICKAQINLVLNPSFEDHTHCPDMIDEAKYSSYWSSLDTAWNPPDWAHANQGIPEYCHTCATYADVHVPLWGNRYPRTGDGLMIAQLFFDQPDTMIWTRDYLQGHLARTLHNGHRYQVQFFVTSPVISAYAINNIGAYFDDGTIDTTHFPGMIQNQYTPQVLEPSIVYDTVNWVKIEGSFLSDGTERVFTIGNFCDKTHMSYVAVHDTSNSSWHGGFRGYYLVDDVTVIDCSNVPFAGNDTLITAGDSVFLGPHEILLPYTWYKLGDTMPIPIAIGSSGVMVHPTVTTTYVLKLELCGRTLYDTVTVSVFPAGISSLSRKLSGAVSIYPNPATNEVTISACLPDKQGADNCEVVFYDMVGREMLSAMVNGELLRVNIEGLANGVYFVVVIDKITGEKVVRKIIKSEP